MCKTLSSGKEVHDRDYIGCSLQDFDVKWFAQRCNATGRRPGSLYYYKDSGYPWSGPMIPCDDE